MKWYAVSANDKWWVADDMTTDLEAVVSDYMSRAAADTIVRKHNEVFDKPRHSLDEDEFSRCDCCGSYATETTDDDGDGGPLGHVQCAQCSEIADLQSKLDERTELLRVAQVDLEKERVRLAACGVGAQVDTPESIEKHRLAADNEYWSDSLRMVYEAADERNALRSRLDAALKEIDRYHSAESLAIVRETSLQSRLDESAKVLDDCELSLSAFDPSGSSEYWLWYHSPHEPVDEVRARIKAAAVERRETNCTATSKSELTGDPVRCTREIGHGGMHQGVTTGDLTEVNWR